ncbi:serine protein kinase PrkA [Bdellovibrionota bacterium FG-1]
MAMGRTSSFSAQEVLSSIDQSVKKEFDSNRRILSYDEYLALLGEYPERQTRSSATYLADMMDHFGRDALPKPEISGAPQRFKLFDFPVDSMASKVVGQEHVQNQIYRTLRTFSRQGINNKLILLHGPNGSAKSSIAHALMSGLEKYSKENQDGAQYTFNWVFPVDRVTKGGIGINTAPYGTTKTDATGSFAKLPDDEVSARVPCELRDHPLLLIPQDQRQSFLEKLLGSAKAHEVLEKMPHYLTRGDLCHRCRQIFDALLTANQGDYRKVLAHIQVERMYFARRYRRGLVTIEPQLHVDAQFQYLTYSKSMSALPVSLQSLNLFTLQGDLIDGNRGIIEYSDLLKRPVDSFKYLLGVCETGSVNVATTIAYLDTVMIGSTNEVQLDAFKEFPDFTSFKARIELIRVPYLLSVSEERQIYVSQLSQMAGEKHLAPHVDWTAALWAILTRLKKPNSINYPPTVSTLVSNLSPIEKVRLYDSGEVPSTLSLEERKILRANLRKIREEYINIPYYEGRMGASAREIKSILFDAAQNPEFQCLSPLAALRELEEFVKRVSEYEFLKQEIKDGFHDAQEFINTTRVEYLNRVDREVRDSIGLYDSAQWEEFVKRYVQQISLVLKKEKQKNPMTGEMEDPDFSLIEEFETIVDAPQDSGDKENFRQNVISQIGVWSLDHRGEPVVYAHVFKDFWNKLEEHYFESQKLLLTKMHDALLVYDKGEAAPTTSEGGKLAQTTIANMVARQGYCDKCAKEVILFLMRSRY